MSRAALEQESDLGADATRARNRPADRPQRRRHRLGAGAPRRRGWGKGGDRLAERRHRLGGADSRLDKGLFRGGFGAATPVEINVRGKNLADDREYAGRIIEQVTTLG